MMRFRNGLIDLMSAMHGKAGATTAGFDGRVVLPYAATIFLSAFLLFQVQPLISKLILPWFGGSPTVWTTAMLFFQSVLFGGYLYAHLIARHATPRVQAAIHVTLLLVAAGLAVLVVPGQALRPVGDEDPVGRILLLLGLSVGLPYFSLATTGPLIQHWYTQAHPRRSAFRLYALSNLGSFIALLSFPYVFEPLFELPQLGRFWTWGFWVFALLCAAITLRASRAVAPRPVAAVSSAPGTDAPGAGAGVPVVVVSWPGAAAAIAQPTLAQRVGWIVLPALASLVFIATTDHVSHDIAPEPRLWIATLSLYLLTFIVCFDHPRWYRRGWVAAASLLAVAVLAGRDEVPGWFGAEWDYGVAELRWIHLGAMFLLCLMCHGELYRRRPGNHRYLTEFYLWMSFGGACGGLFVALVATNYFDDYHEWPLTLVGGIALAGVVLASQWRAGAALVATACLGLAGLVLYWERPLQWRSTSNALYTDTVLHLSRNFYGTVAVKERRYKAGSSEDYREYFSGQITHGLQYLDADKRRKPVTYYSEGSGVGETLGYAMAREPSLRVAMIGLGAGTLATYARPADHYDFYEINPEAVRVANQWFDNLSSCRAQTRRIIVGDARLKMEQLPADLQYDVIVLDAFTGGSVPIHLLTREAFQIYRRHLKPDGFIVVHITNAYLNLYPVVRRQAEALGMGFRNKFQPRARERHVHQNHYFVMTDDREYLRRFPSENRRHLDANGKLLRVEDPDLPDVPLWTDHFSSLNPIELRD